MKWYKYLSLFLLLFIFVPIVKAETCSNSEIVKYQELAKNIEITYDYVESDNNVFFKIKLSNLIPGLLVRDVAHNKNYNYTSDNIELQDQFYQGTSYKFYVYMETCSNKKVYSHYITLPYYNYLYNDEICKGIEKFKYCQKWVKTQNYEELKSKIEKYKQDQTKKEEVNEKQNGLFDDLFEIYLNYYYIILPIIIIILSVTIWRYNRKEDLF